MAKAFWGFGEPQKETTVYVYDVQTLQLKKSFTEIQAGENLGYSMAQDKKKIYLGSPRFDKTDNDQGKICMVCKKTLDYTPKYYPQINWGEMG